MADGGEEKKSGKDGFLPTLYTDFFMLRPWNWNLFNRGCKRVILSSLEKTFGPWFGWKRS
jgi:hypothetical protein